MKIGEDLQEFISQTELNKKPYETLLKKYGGDKNNLKFDNTNQINIIVNFI